MHNPKNESQERILIFQRNQYILSINKRDTLKGVGWNYADKYIPFKCSAWSQEIAI